MCVGLLGLGTYYYIDEELSRNTDDISWLPVVALVLYVFSYSYGFGPMPWVVMSEIFAPRYKNIAAGFNAAFNWLMGFIVTTSFKSIQEVTGSAYIFWAYSAFNLLAVACVFVFLPETKGKSLQEIQAIFGEEVANPLVVESAR